MDELKKVKEKFVTSIWFEIATFVGMFIVEGVLRYTHSASEMRLGSASSQGYGWGLIMGGWTLYLPMIAVIVTWCVVYITAIKVKVDYLSAIPTVSHSAAMYIILRVGSLVLYIKAIFFMFGMVKSTVFTVGGILGICEVLLQYVSYANLFKDLDE